MRTLWKLSGGHTSRNWSKVQEHVENSCQLTVLFLIDGEFGAMMKVDIINDGPVTIIIDSPSEIKSTALADDELKQDESSAE
jgi:hypothetical protein